MKPAEVKDKIRRVEEQLKIEEIEIQHLLRYRNKKNFKERMSKQQDIIDEATTSMTKIQNQFDTALENYQKVGRRRRALKKELVLLKNHENIERLKKLAEQLRKETSDGKTDSNTQG